MKKAKLLLISFLILLGKTTFSQAQNEKPNILWITCEDISPTLACYGDKAAKTPNIDQLAKEGVRFTNAFSCVGVCAPSRSSIITGMYPVSIGTHNMRTGKDIFGISNEIYAQKTGVIDSKGIEIPEYSAVIPEKVKCFTEFLREADYYCTNNAKTDYQFAPPITAWNENDEKAHWRNRPDGKPFFSVFNLNISHESQIWKKKNDSLWINKNSIQIPPYFPENKIIRQDVARNYSNIAEMDKQVGELIAQLKADGLYENTIIFFFSDHGGPLPRGKREAYDSGLKVPMIIRFPNKENSNTLFEDMVSFVDLAPTILSLVGIEKPKYMQGQAFLGKYKNPNPRTEIFGSRDRMDEHYDRMRVVRTKDFLYVKNFHPEWGNYQNIQYRLQMDMMNELLRLNKDNQLDSLQSIWFKKTKPTEELYDVKKDPFQLHNLAADKKYASELKLLRKKLKKWQKQVKDLGVLAESDLLSKMWPDFKQPQTIEPNFYVNKEKKIEINCKTKGASIAYQITQKDEQAKTDWKYWNVYSKPISLQENEDLHSIAIRIGYKHSKICKFQ